MIDEQDTQDPEPTEPTEEELSADPEEQGGSQEAVGDGGADQPASSKRGEPEPEPSGLDVPGAWRGPDEPGQGEDSEDNSEDAGEGGEGEE